MAFTLQLPTVMAFALLLAPLGVICQVAPATIASGTEYNATLYLANATACETHDWVRRPASVPRRKQMEVYAKEIKEMRQARKVVPLVFYGDSVTECLRGTRAGGTISGSCLEVHNVFNLAFQRNFTAMSFGLSGDTTDSLMWRLLYGNNTADKIGTKVISLNIGLNDLKGIENMTNTREISKLIDDTVMRAQCIIDWLLDVDSHPYILLQGIFYRLPNLPEDGRKYPTEFTIAIDEVNYALSAWAEQSQRVHFVDCNRELLTNDGLSLDVTKFMDLTHPNAAGWSALFSCLIPQIHDLMEMWDNDEQTRFNNYVDSLTFPSG